MIRRLVLKDVAAKYPEQSKAIAEMIFVSMGYEWVVGLLGVLIPLHLGVIVMIALLILLWPLPIVFFWQQVLTIVANPIGRVGAVILLVLSGFLLYLARTYMRPIYGVTEVFIGIATCWVGLSYPNPSAKALSASLVVFGGIYIIIRGFDNILDDKTLTDLSPKPAEAAAVRR
jgi:hypothetical protein